MPAVPYASLAVFAPQDEHSLLGAVVERDWIGARAVVHEFSGAHVLVRGAAEELVQTVLAM